MHERKREYPEFDTTAEPTGSELDTPAPEKLRNNQLDIRAAAHLTEGSAPVSIRRKDDGSGEPPAAASSSLIVEDSATDLAEGQMQRSAFLGQLRGSVTRTADEALAGTIWSAVGCPWIEYWFNYYGNRGSRDIERSILQYVPEAAGVSSAAEYIPLVTARVRSGIAGWRESGKMQGVPGGALGGAPAAGQQEGVFGRMMNAGAGVVRNLFFKTEAGADPSDADPGVVQSRLGEGTPLEGTTRSRMEHAFGTDLGRIRIHTDDQASRLSKGMHARAFTVGDHVAFRSGEYHPGSPVGQALLAHELAHAVQQQSGTALSPAAPSATTHDRFEDEADNSAVAAVVRLWGTSVAGVRGWGRSALPRLKTGLRLSRCAEEPSPTGVHYDEAISCAGTPQEMMEGAYPNLTSNTDADRDEILANLESMNAGGVYVFFGHSASESLGSAPVGINPDDGSTIRGSDIEDALSEDENPPTMVVLGACASESLLGNVRGGGVPIAVGFTENVANAVAASAVGRFMEALNNGDTFAQATTVANDFMAGSFSPLARMVVQYGEGYNSGMTLEEAKQQHRGE